MRKKRKYILRRIIVIFGICVFLMGFAMIPVENAASQVASSKIILISLVGIIAIAMIFIGIGVNKNILKK